MHSRLAPTGSFHHPPDPSLRPHPLLPKQHHINKHIILSQFLAQFHQFRIRRIDRRAGKDDHALTGILVFPVFERELGHLDGGDDVGRTADGGAREGR